MDLIERIINSIQVSLIILPVYILFFAIDYYFDKGTIQNNLAWIVPVFLGVTLFLLIFSFLFSFKDLKKLFKKIDRKTWIVLLLVFLVGFSLRVFVAPHTHRLYFDEDMYLEMGQNIVRSGRAVVCQYGTPDKCYSWIYNKEPAGYPFLISTCFLFGNIETPAYYFTAIISSLTILTVFFIAYLLFENKKISLFSTLIFVLIPVAIRWAPTTSTDTVFMFFSGLVVFAFLSYFKNSSNRLLLFSFASLAYAIQIRPEGILLIFIVMFMFIFFKRNLFSMIGKKWFLIIFVIFLLLIVPHLLHLNSVKEDNWGSSQNKLGLEYVSGNLYDNGMFFFENTRFPVVFSIFALIGLFLYRFWKESLFLVLWFVLFFGLYLLFYAGSFNYGVDVRYSLTMYPPVAILGGCGAFLIADTLNKFVAELVDRKWSSMISIVVVILVISASFFPFISFVSSNGEKAWDARLHHDFLVEKMKELDDDSWIITLVPSIVLINGKNAIDPNFLRDQEKLNKLLTKNTSIYFYEGYWCQSEPFKSNICQYIHDNFHLIIYDKITEKYRTYTLYKVNLVR